MLYPLKVPSTHTWQNNMNNSTLFLFSHNYNNNNNNNNNISNNNNNDNLYYIMQFSVGWFVCLWVGGFACLGFFLEMVAHTRLKLDGWVELGPSYNFMASCI